ncbi:MAG: hypothetical protein ACFCD0_12425 [Gemmataceae bacterium]
MKNFAIALALGALVSLTGTVETSEAQGCRTGRGRVHFGGGRVHFGGGRIHHSFGHHIHHRVVRHHCSPPVFHGNRVPFYSVGYRGWSRRCYFPRYRCYGYFCPQRHCWYYFHRNYNCYLPTRFIEQFPPVNINQNTNVNVNQNIVNSPGAALPPGAVTVPGGAGPIQQVPGGFPGGTGPIVP